MVPRRDALLGRTFETRKISSRRPAIASAITGSASPYISAVSILVMASSTPPRNAAAAPPASPPSMYQVPCPITDTLSLLLPNFRDFISIDPWSDLPMLFQIADIRDQHRARH